MNGSVVDIVAISFSCFVVSVVESLMIVRLFVDGLMKSSYGALSASY